MKTTHDDTYVSLNFKQPRGYIMLNEKERELIKSAIREGCRYFWKIEIKDSAFNFSGQRPYVGEDDIKIRSLNFYFKDLRRCYSGDRFSGIWSLHISDVLHFHVKVFKNNSLSEWFSIDAKFTSRKLIVGRVKSSKGSKKPLSISVSPRWCWIFVDA